MKRVTLPCRIACTYGRWRSSIAPLASACAKLSAAIEELTAECDQELAPELREALGLPPRDVARALLRELTALLWSDASREPRMMTKPYALS